MPTNLIFEPGWKQSVVCTNPTGPVVGAPVRVGLLTGMALTDEGEGGNDATHTTVDFGPGMWDLAVTDTVGGGIAVGDALFYVDGAGDAAGTISNNSAGYFFGFAMEIVGAGATTTINVMHVPSPAAGALGAGTVGTANLAAGLLSADANGRAKMAAGLFDVATVLAKFAAGSFTTANLTALIPDDAVTNAILLDIVLNGAFQADAATRALFADAIWTEAKIALNSLTGTVAANVADANVIGGLPVLFRIDCADASANVDVVSTHKVRVIDAWALNTGIAAHAANDTWQVKNGANAISDAVAKTATVNAIKRISTIDPAQAEIAAGGTLRVTTVKDTNAAVTVYVLALRVA
jgi:hypothetical protein